MKDKNLPPNNGGIPQKKEWGTVSKSTKPHKFF
jgi:hypothetical protein